MINLNKFFLLLVLFFFLFFPFFIIQVVTSALLIAVLISLLYTRYSISNISVEPEIDKFYLHNSDKGFINYKIYNNSSLSFENLLIKLQGNGAFDSNEGDFLHTIPGKSFVNCNCQINTSKRGVYKVGPTKIYFSDPLNFFTFQKVFEIYTEVIVYPKFHNMELMLINGTTGGNRKVKNIMYEDMTDLKSIRDYRVGDSLKRVNWKATAKEGKLQVMEFYNNITTPLLIIADFNPHNYDIKRRYECVEMAIEYAASLVISYTQLNESCSLFSLDDNGEFFIPPGTGYAHSVSILERLSTMELSGNMNNNVVDLYFSNNWELMNNSHIYIILHEMKEELYGKIELLKSRKHLVKVIEMKL